MRWWKPWTAELVGTESGNVRPLQFLRFWTERQAMLWCEQTNGNDLRPLVFFRPSRRSNGRADSAPPRNSSPSQTESDS